MQQKGKSLVVLVSLSPYYTVLQKMVPDFVKLTGIQVEYQVVPEQQLRQKMPIEMNAKSPAIDAFASSLHVEKLLFSAGRLVRAAEQVPGQPQPDAARLQLEGLRPGRHLLGRQGGRDRHRRCPWASGSSRTSTEGPLRPEGTEGGDDARRARGGGEGDAPAAGGLRLHRPRPQERQHPGVGLLPPRARRELPGRLQDHAPDDVDRRPSRRRGSTGSSCGATRRRAPSASTGWSPRARSRRVWSRRGRTACPSRRRSRIPTKSKVAGEGGLRAAPGQRPDEALRRHLDGRHRAQPVREEQGRRLAVRRLGEQPPGPVAADGRRGDGRHAATRSTRTPSSSRRTPCPRTGWPASTRP